MIILKLIQIDEHLLQVGDYVSTLALDTCFEREGGEVEKEQKEMVDSLSALTLLGDGRYSISPRIHCESEAPGGLLTVVFDTCDDKSKGIGTVTSKDTPKCPSYVIASIFVLF